MFGLKRRVERLEWESKFNRLKDKWDTMGYPGELKKVTDIDTVKLVGERPRIVTDAYGQKRYHCDDCIYLSSNELYLLMNYLEFQERNG